jgi:hypothetical protein
MIKLSDDRIDFTDGCCITDIICACLAFIVLITTDGRLVSIDTDPSVVIVDNIPFIFVLMLYLRLSCCRHPSSDKAIIVCPNGKKIFVDFNNSRLVIFNDDGTLDKEINCSRRR